MSTDTDTSSLIERALAAAAERDRARAETQAERRREKISQLRQDAVSKLAMILDDDPADEISEERVAELREIVDGWEVVTGHGPYALPIGLVGELDGIPLGILPDPERTYGTAILSARFGEVDGARFLATSESIVRTLADLPDCLEELDRNLTEETDAIRRQLDEDDRPTTGQARPTAEEADAAATMLDAIRSLSAEGLLAVAEIDLATAAQVAPMVAAAQLERIADLIDDRLYAGS